jgi:hypothetical protein
MQLKFADAGRHKLERHVNPRHKYDRKNNGLQFARAALRAEAAARGSPFRDASKVHEIVSGRRQGRGNRGFARQVSAAFSESTLAPCPGSVEALEGQVFPESHGAAPARRLRSALLLIAPVKRLSRPARKSLAQMPLGRNRRKLQVRRAAHPLHPGFDPWECIASWRVSLL